jgi:GntR family transcriptional repressor for pyruvate dehydrogenase complex
VVRNGIRGEELYQRLRGRILEGVYPLSSRLPSEPALCQEFGVSRPVVRETLARLRVEGLVVSRQGAGTFVRPVSAGQQTGFAPVRNLNDVQQCFEFRTSLEGEAAYLAARHRTADDLAAISGRAEAFAASTAGGNMADDEDFAFHEAVANSTGITFFASVMVSMRRHVMVGMKLAGELSGVGVQERLGLVREEHRAVVDAVAAGDAERARQAMRKHIENSRRRLFG